MTTQPGSAGTAGRDYRVPDTTGRHRAPPPPPTPPTAAWWTVAVAAGALTVASVAAIGVDVAPDARAVGVHGTTVAAASSTTAGPLELPTIGAVATTETRTAQRPVTVVRTAVRTQRPASTSQAVLATLATSEQASEQNVTPPPQPVTTPPAATTPTAPPAATTASATPEEPTVTTTAASTTRRTGRPR